MTGFGSRRPTATSYVILLTPEEEAAFRLGMHLELLTVVAYDEMYLVEKIYTQHGLKFNGQSFEDMHLLLGYKVLRVVGRFNQEDVFQRADASVDGKWLQHVRYLGVPPDQQPPYPPGTMISAAGKRGAL